MSYARTRHYSHIDKDSKKPQFNHCRLDLEELKTLLNSQGVSLSNGKADGSIGQSQSGNIPDLELKDSSPVQQSLCGRRLVWFRTLAFQANDHGFESRRPHQLCFYLTNSKSQCCVLEQQNEGCDYEISCPFLSHLYAWPSEKLF